MKDSRSAAPLSFMFQNGIGCEQQDSARQQLALTLQEMATMGCERGYAASAAHWLV